MKILSVLCVAFGGLIFGQLAFAGDDKNDVYITGNLLELAVNSPGPAQNVSFFIATTEPEDMRIKVICDGNNYFALECTDFVGDSTVIGAKFEFFGQLVFDPFSDVGLVVRVTMKPNVIAKP